MKHPRNRLERRLLKFIVETPAAKADKGVSLRGASYHLGVSVEEVHIAARSLKSEGLIQLHEIIHNFLVATPTKLGKESYNTWSDERHARLTKPLKKLGVIIFGSLLTSAVGFLIWYLGLNPSSTILLPLTRHTPMKIHYPDGQDVTLWAIWMVNDVGEMKRAFSRPDPSPFYEANFPDATLATLDGTWSYEFDVENTAKFSQARLGELLVEFTREPIPDLIDLYENPHGLGGGVIREFESTLSSDDSTESHIQVVPASPTEDADFDYLTFSPGERELVKLNLTLPTPGLYRITPIVKFRFRDQEYEHRLETFNLVFPEIYRMWFTSKNGHGHLVSYHFTVNRSGSVLTLDNLVSQPPLRPIIFETTVVDDKCRVFIIEGYSVRHLANEGQLFECAGMLRWTEDGEGIVFEESPYLEDARVYSFDLLTSVTQEIGHVVPYTPNSLTYEQRMEIEKRYGQKHSEPSWSPMGDQVAVVIERSDSSVENSAQSGQIVILNTDSLNIVEIKASDWCDSPSWSPSGRRIIFACRSPIGYGYVHPGDPSELWVAETTSGNAMRISQEPGLYEYYEWSEDEKSVLVGGDGVRVFQTDDKSPPCTIFEIPFGCHKCISSPRWKP